MELPLFTELKRRRVFRAVLGYGVAAFAVLQIVEPVMHGLHWPDVVLSWVVVALAAGLPVVVALAWIFDVNASGISRTASAQAHGARLTLLLVGVGLLAAAPAIVWVLLRSASGNTSKADAPSIAVLPFADLSPAHDQDYFSDGVAEEILTALSNVDGLRVPGRASSFFFKGRNEAPAEIARMLGVTYLLEGSVRRDQARLRITAEVVKAATGERLWARRFDRELTDVFAIQDEIARAVVESLEGKLLGGRAGAPQPVPRTSPEAYNQYLLGERFYRRFSGENFVRAVAAYEKALELDSRFAPAWAALGVPLYLVATAADTQAEALATAEKAMAAAQKALLLSPDLCDGLSTRGFLRQVLRWDWTGAEQDLVRAVQLCPGDPDAWRRYAILLDNLGRTAEALAAAERAVDLDPLGHSAIKLGQLQLDAGKNAAARATFERAMQLTPDAQNAARGLADALLAQGESAAALERYRQAPGSPAGVEDGIAAALHSLGRSHEAHALLDELQAQPRPDPVALAHAYGWMGDRDKAFQWLDRAVADRDLTIGETEVRSFWFRSLHGDDRWKVFLRKMNFPQE